MAFYFIVCRRLKGGHFVLKQLIRALVFFLCSLFNFKKNVFQNYWINNDCHCYCSMKYWSCGEEKTTFHCYCPQKSCNFIAIIFLIEILTERVSKQKCIPSKISFTQIGNIKLTNSDKNPSNYGKAFLPGYNLMVPD